MLSLRFTYLQDGSFIDSMYQHLPPFRQNIRPASAGHSFMPIPSFPGFTEMVKQISIKINRRCCHRILTRSFGWTVFRNYIEPREVRDGSLQRQLVFGSTFIFSTIVPYSRFNNEIRSSSGKVISYVSASSAKISVDSLTHRKWTKIYFVLFLFIDRPSLNHVTFGAGSPSTLHTILTRFPSLTVKLGDIDSIEARLPAKERERERD